MAFYIATKGKHPFGPKPDRLRNLLDGNPVGLGDVSDPVLRDLISWMLSHDPKDRPSAKQALKHPCLQSIAWQFEMLCAMGNQQEIRTEDINSPVVQQLKSDTTDWRTSLSADVLTYLSTDFLKGKTYTYRSSWTECLRLMRNVNQHWRNRPRPLPQPEPFYKVGDPQEYFLKLFPTLPVDVHRIVRSCDWKDRFELKDYY